MSDLLEADSEFLQDDDYHFSIPASVFEVEGLTIYEQMAFMVIKSYAGQNLTTWPGIKKIAARARMSERQAQYAIKTLESMGLLKVERMRFEQTKAGTMRQTSNRYRVMNPRSAKKKTNSVETGRTICTGEGGAQHAPGGRTTCTGRGAEYAPQELDHFELDQHNVCVKGRDVSDLVDEYKKTTSDERTPERHLTHTMRGLLKHYGKAKLQEKLQVIAGMNFRSSPLAALKAALKEDWNIGIIDEIKAASKQVAAAQAAPGRGGQRDERYSAFYDLFPDL